MNLEETDQKDLPGSKRDVRALYARLGLEAAGYREFERSRTQTAAVSEAPSAELGPRPLHSLETMPAPARLIEAPHTKEARWNALNTMAVGTEPSHRAARARATRVAFFSLAGGVGKTTLAVNVARALSSRSRDAVLVNCSHSFSFEPYLSSRTPRFGVLSFLHAPAGVAALPVTVIQSAAAELTDEARAGSPALFLEQASSSSEILLFDMPVGLDHASRELLSSVDHLIVPLVPDLQSGASANVIEALLRIGNRRGPEISFLFNRYDESRSFHREIRSRVSKLLGARLLPITVREDRALQEAAGSGLVLAEHAPESPVLSDLHALTGWICSLGANSIGTLPEIARGATA